MAKSILKVLSSLSDEVGLLLDENSGTVYGNKSGYNVCMNQLPNVRAFYITVSVKRGDKMPEHSEMNEIVKANKKYLKQCEVTRYKVRFQTQIGPGLNYNNALAKAKAALDEVVAALRQKGFENACQHCGTTEGVESYSMNDSPAFMCTPCCQEYSESREEKRMEQERKKENLIGGITGAFLGSLLGVACIVLVGQLGYVASLSGLVMGVCALKGYELLGSKLSKKGIAISILLMLVMVYVGQRIDYAIEVAKVFEVDVITGFHAIPSLLEEGVIEAPGYYGDLAMLYLFTALGGGSAIYNALKNMKSAQSAVVIYRLGEYRESLS